MTSRGRWIAAALTLAGVVALVAWSLRPGADAAATDLGRGEDATAATALRTGDAPAGEEAASDLRRARRAPTGDRGTTDGLVLTVLDAETARPVSGALAAALADSAALRESGVARGEDLLALAETDMSGEARLAWPAERPPARIVVRAAGYRVAAVEPPISAGTRHEVRLRRGLRIAGVVLDVAGRPVADVAVAAAHGALPRAELAAELPPVPGRETATATSDAQGSFVLEGLGEGPYRLRVLADGWALDPSVQGTRTRLPHPADAVHARAGDEQVRIVLVPVRTVRLRVLDAATSLPVTRAVVTADVSAGPGTEGTSIVARAADEGSEPGLVTGTVFLDDNPAEVGVADVGDAVVHADGYALARAPVALRLPSDTSAVPDEVRLVPEDASATGTLVVDCARDVGTIWRPATRVLSGCRRADRRAFHARGRRLDGERWEFTGLPPGEATVRVFDGLSTSLPQEARIPERGVGAAAVRFPEPTGLVLTLKDEEGRRAFDADLVLVVPPGQDRGAPNLAAITRWRADDAGLRETLHPLEPGTYRWAVSKRGVGEASGETTVVAGRVVRVEATLEPKFERQRVQGSVRR